MQTKDRMAAVGLVHLTTDYCLYVAGRATGERRGRLGPYMRKGDEDVIGVITRREAEKKLTVPEQTAAVGTVGVVAGAGAGCPEKAARGLGRGSV